MNCLLFFGVEANWGNSPQAVAKGSKKVFNFSIMPYSL